MPTSDASNPLEALSNALAEAVSTAGKATIMVDARRRLPASGISIAPDLVLTADHVVERDDDILVTLPGGEQVPATIAGRDPSSDIALLRLDGANPTQAKPALQKALVGQLVLALGRPSPEGIQASLGVVSAIGGPIRTRRGSLIRNYLRTDTIPYPGFSGGPLINPSGQVVGLNTSGLARGIPLTIPAHLAFEIAKALEEHGHVRRGYLGIRSQPVSIPTAQRQALGREQPIGLLLVDVEDGEAASKGGLLIGDILVGLDEYPISDPDELMTRLFNIVPGQSIRIEVLRGGQPLTLTVKIGNRQ